MRSHSTPSSSEDLRPSGETTYTRETPFYVVGIRLYRVLIAYILYIDTLLGINQIVCPSCRRATRPSMTESGSWKPRSFEGFRSSGRSALRRPLDRHRLMNLSKYVQASESKTHHGKALSAGISRERTNTLDRRAEWRVDARRDLPRRAPGRID